MNRHTSHRIMFSATGIAGLLATPAMAQDANVPANTDDIVVTARRVQENVQDVPISITVLNQQQVTNRNITNSTELAQYVPSLGVNGRFGPEKASFSLRGFSQELNTLPTVGVYFADVVAPRLLSNITSGNGAGVGTLFDLQNVQVLKGPQGTLFGRNTTGGAILLVPHKPTDQFGGYVEGSIGNYNQRRVEAVLNLPLSETFKVRLGLDHNQRDGYIKNQSGIGPRDFNDLDYISVRLGVVADLTPNLENYLLATYVRSSTNGTLGHEVYCAQPSGPVSSGSGALTRAAACAQLAGEQARGFSLYDVDNSDPTAFLRSTTWQVINTTTLKASDTLTIKNIVSYGQAREAYSFNITGDFTATPFVTTYPGPHRPQGNESTFTEEFQLQGRSLGNRLNWQAGVYHERSNPLGSQEQYTQIFAQCSDIYAFKCAPLFFNSPKFGLVPVGQVSVAHNNYAFRNDGLYAQATYKLTERLSLTGGIRYTWDREQEDADNIKIVPLPTGPAAFSCSRATTPLGGANSSLLTNGACTRSFIQKSRAPTWLADLDYKPTGDLLLYAKYARGYRGGGINEANFGAETWQPEKLDTFEVGAKTSFRGGVVHGTFNIAGFWNEFKNQQATVVIPQCTAADPGCTSPAPTGINGIQNVGRSRIRGIEIDASLTAFDSLRFDLGYAYLDAKVTGATTPVCDSTRFLCSAATFLTQVGATLPFAPKNRVTLTATYTLPLDKSIGEISVGGTFVHTDSQFYSHANDAAFAAGAIPFNDLAGHRPAQPEPELAECRRWSRRSGILRD
jgi:iron complex outermembrane receptor protein